MAQSYIQEIGDKLGGNGVPNTNGEHVKIIAPAVYTRTDDGVVSHPSIQDAIDNISPKAKVVRTLVQHTVTVEEATSGLATFSDPLDMPSDYGNLTVALISLVGTIIVNDTSNVQTALRIALDFDSSHSYGAETYAVNVIIPDTQVNFGANTQIRLNTGTMHPSGLYLEIYNHGLPAGAEIRVTGIITVFDR